jgi:hypothetical protein
MQVVEAPLPGLMQVVEAQLTQGAARQLKFMRVVEA